MIVRKLRLRNFRNYERAEIEFSSGLNLFVGLNAQGKTNLLESLVYLSLTRSHRITDDTQMIRHGCPFAEMECEFEDGIEKRIGVRITPQGKTLLYNRMPVKKSSEFIGLLNVVLFAPDDLSLFHDQPRERRRVMNQEITKILPRYLNALNRYQALLKERNTLLRNPRPDLTYLDTLDEQMVREETIIIEDRRSFIAGVNGHMKQIYQELSETDADVKLDYRSCIDGSEKQIESALQEMYRESRQRDLDTFMSNQGIQREDISFLLNGRNIIDTASQGQKRMMMLAFRLSLLHYIREQTGRSAVLLLDDVLSELDEQRQKKLMELVSDDVQCMITATEIPAFLKAAHPASYTVTDGKVEKTDGGRA
jgi:DNA replication and repair protein RecF